MLSAVDGTLQASQTTDYYPFGLAHATNNLNKNKYLFSGKELQDGQLGGSMLGWYDFGARFYDPILGRWFNVDPAAQVANPYLFCGNAPMMYIDQDGRIFWLIPVLGALIGGAMNVVSHLDDIHNFWGALGYFGVGAAVGAASAYAGGWIADASKDVYKRQRLYDLDNTGQYLGRSVWRYPKTEGLLCVHAGGGQSDLSGSDGIACRVYALGRHERGADASVRQKCDGHRP